MQKILDQNLIAEETINRTTGAFGDKIGVFSKLFGCWHKSLSRPFSNKNSAYRACLHCGARKKFDTKTLKTVGPFYYPPAIGFIVK